MSFLIHGLDPQPFAPLFALSDDELVARGARRVFADESPGYPCRVSLEDAAIRDEMVLVNFEHHASSSPYRASGPVYVRRVARDKVVLDRVPDVLARRVLSVRAYNDAGMMVAADVADGREVRGLLERMLGRRDVGYLHVHYAKPGCYACRVMRA